MIKFENTEVMGWEHAIRGMRNPMNSHNKMDSFLCTEKIMTNEEIDATCGICPNNGCCDIYDEESRFVIGPNDYDLMKRLRNAGTDHRKFMRMITVYVDITAPLYFWKEHDQYKVGTTTNSCSTMHKIHAKEFTIDDFSHEHLRVSAKNCLLKTIEALNAEREAYIGDGLPDLKGDKQCWYSMIQLLPSSYNQKRTVLLNYEVLANMYKSRKNHKLTEWRDFCVWIETLPYSELITGEFIKEE